MNDKEDVQREKYNNKNMKRKQNKEQQGRTCDISQYNPLHQRGRWASHFTVHLVFVRVLTVDVHDLHTLWDKNQQHCQTTKNAWKNLI